MGFILLELVVYALQLQNITVHSVLLNICFVELVYILLQLGQLLNFGSQCELLVTDVAI